MEDSEILARFEHEAEMREQIAQDLREHNKWADEKFKSMRVMDRWRWAVGIVTGLLLSRTPDGLEFLRTVLE